MGDLFTKWVKAVPLPNKEATTCMQPITEFLCQFGVPEQIHSDKGTKFVNQVLYGVCLAMGVHRTPY